MVKDNYELSGLRKDGIDVQGYSEVCKDGG